MIYCFKKLKAIHKLHIFFLSYSISIVFGFAFIMLMNLGLPYLQAINFMILFIVYYEPTYFIMRRIDYWTIRDKVRNSDMTLSEKVEGSYTINLFKPHADMHTIGFIVVNILWIMHYAFGFFPISNLSKMIETDPTALANITSVSIGSLILMLPLVTIGILTLLIIRKDNKLNGYM